MFSVISIIILITLSSPQFIFVHVFSSLLLFFFVAVVIIIIIVIIVIAFEKHSFSSEKKTSDGGKVEKISNCGKEVCY